MRLVASIGFACGLLFCTCLSARDLRIENVTVVSPERDAPLLKASVVIRNDRIVSVGTAPPANSGQIIDGTGLYLAPGLIDAHVHLGDVPGMTPEQQQANARMADAALAQMPLSYLYFGFTTLVDLLGNVAKAKGWNAQTLRPDLYFCGGAPVLDGYPMNWTPKPLRYELWSYLIVQPADTASVPAGMDPAAHTPEAVVKRMRADGAICVKSFFERGFGDATQLPVPSHDTIDALIRTARQEQIPVFLHANSSEAQAFAVQAGVDAIVHGMWHWTADAQQTATIPPPVRRTLDDIVESKTGWQATIQVLYGELDVLHPTYLANPLLARVVPADLIQWYGTTEGQHLRTDIASWLLKQPASASPESIWKAGQDFYAPLLARNRNVTAYLARRNARFLFGSDTPSSLTYANPPGLNGWLEMRRLAEAGLTPTQIFRAATIVNAQAIGLESEIGTVEQGKRANLLLLRKDPTQSVDAYNEIVKVIVGGKVVDREELAADRKQGGGP
jgi:imidazolonepropionase-like amidohydrolase